MIEFDCEQVYAGWSDVANPDDIDVTLRLDRTCHEFYPALRELVLLYDVVRTGREFESAIGTGDFVAVTNKDKSSEFVQLELAPVTIILERNRLVAALEELLSDVFERKDRQSTAMERQNAFEYLEQWIRDNDGETDIESVYERLVT